MRGKESIVPYTIMAKAVKGDVDAMNYVLKHFEGYIITLSKQTLYDEFGNAYSHIDPEIRRQLETKLIVSVLKFEIEIK